MLDNRAARIGPADDTAVSFLRRGDYLHLGEAVPDLAPAVPAGNTACSCAQGRMIICALHLSGHIAVLDNCSGICFPDHPTDRHKSFHRYIHRSALPNRRIVQVACKCTKLVNPVGNAGMHNKYILDHRLILDYIRQNPAARCGNLCILNHQVMDVCSAQSVKQRRRQIQNLITVPVQFAGKCPGNGRRVRRYPCRIQILGQFIASIRIGRHLIKQLLRTLD